MAKIVNAVAVILVLALGAQPRVLPKYHAGNGDRSRQIKPEQGGLVVYTMLLGHQREVLIG